MDRLKFYDFLSSTSSSESEDERRARVVKPRNNLLEDLDDVEFRKRFRMRKNTFQRLAVILDGVLEPIDNRNQPISKINIGNHFNISQASVSRIIGNVTRHVAALRHQFINMPETEENRRSTALQFYQLAGFPGTLDCTHIKIKIPGGNNAEVFRNRKNWFRINTQVVGDANLKIQDVVRWPGSVHDTTIFNDSHIRARFETNEFNPYCLLGDSGYPCRIYLLTPLEPHNPPEQRYDNAHIRTRNTIERLFGVWKRRFPCLSLGLRTKVERACEVIVATAVLHNLCCEEDDLLEDIFDEPNIDLGIIDIHAHQNMTTRSALIATVFS